MLLNVACKSVQSLGAVNDDARGAPTLITSFLIVLSTFLFHCSILRFRWIFCGFSEEILHFVSVCDSSFGNFQMCFFFSWEESFSHQVQKNFLQIFSRFSPLSGLTVWSHTLGFRYVCEKERFRAVTLLKTAVECYSWRLGSHQNSSLRLQKSGCLIWKIEWLFVVKGKKRWLFTSPKAAIPP